MSDVTNKILSEREILDRVDRMLTHLDRLLVAKEMDQETYDDAVYDIALWEESAMIAARIAGVQP
jgi:hypothetical protein